jgi:hypothetical protein
MNQDTISKGGFIILDSKIMELRLKQWMPEKPKEGGFGVQLVEKRL